MKIKNILSLALFVLIVSFIVSCSDNSTSTTTTPAGTVLYSQDSIAVWFQPTDSAIGTDSLYYATTNSGGVKVEYTIESNADSSHAYGYYSLYTNASPVSLINNPVFGPVQMGESSNFTFASGSTYFALAVKFIVRHNTTPFYLRIKNIKITKL